MCIYMFKYMCIMQNQKHHISLKAQEDIRYTSFTLISLMFQPKKMYNVPNIPKSRYLALFYFIIKNKKFKIQTLF
jgi:hypothetical protein